MSDTVTITSTCYFKVVEEHPPIKVSLIDCIMPPVYTGFLFLYRQGVDINNLKDALEKTCPMYPVLGGKLTSDSKGEYSVLTDNAPGLAFVVADSAKSISTYLLEDHHPDQCHPKIIDPALSPDPNAFAVEKEIPVCVIQVTNFTCGGMSVAIKLQHNVCDGQGVFDFLQSWATTTCNWGGEIPPVTVCHDRSLLDPPDFEPPHHDHNEYLYVAPVTTKPDLNEEESEQPVAPFSMPELDNKRLYFSNEKLTKLKEDLNTQLQDGFVTRNDICSTLIWQSMIRARSKLGVYTNESDEVGIGYACDGRLRLDPPLPKGYFGNVNFYAYTKVNAQSFSKMPLIEGAQILRKATERMNDDYLRDALRFLRQQPTIKDTHESFQAFLGPDLSGTNWANFGLATLDFGNGTPDYSGPPPFVADGLVIFLSTPQIDGGIYAMVTATKEAMNLILKDEKLLELGIVKPS